MRILRAVGVGVLSGLLVGILYVRIVGWIVRRRHPEVIMVAVGGAPMLLAVIVGFVLGFVWLRRWGFRWVVLAAVVGLLLVFL